MNIKDVENLASLARIELGEDEKKSLLSDMENILGYVKQIEEVKVEDVEPEYRVYNVWREDLPVGEAGETIPRDFSRELIVEQFPDAQDGFLKVKKIL
jgi:aspartyl-tRNA(Asn)/glutamyl-tRNA(Gln) amidotransferase subunit C